MPTLSRHELMRRLTLDPQGFIPPQTPGERIALETAEQLGEWVAILSGPCPCSGMKLDDWREAYREYSAWLKGGPDA